MNLALDELTGQEVAVKLLSFNTNDGSKSVDAHMMKKEVEALSSLQHKHIVKLIDSFPKPEKHQLVVIMEYLPGGELYDYWCRFPNRQVPEQEVKEIMLQLAQAIELCHVKKIIHRDLKF